MKLVVKTLFRILLEFGKLLIVLSIIIIVFGLIGINFWAGKFY